MNKITPLKCPIIKKTEICHSIVQILQAGEYKLGSITVRAQLLRDHLRVEVSTDDHNNNVWSRISSESFSPFKPLTYAPPREPIYQIDDCALIRDSMKLPLKKGSERAPPEAT